MSVVLYAIGSVIVVSLIALVAILPLLFKKKISERVLLLLLSLSLGALLGGVFLHFLPEIIEHGYTANTGLFILLGFFTLFIVEKFIHHHHSKCAKNPDKCRGHAYHLAPLNLLGDGVHNFLDGLVIAGSYVVSIPLGIAATVSVIFHEIPQEIADFGVLLYSGWSKFKAVFFNLLSATTAIVGAVIGLLLADKIHHFIDFIIPFAVGNFLYIAAANLVPELHRKHKLLDTILHLVVIAVGIGIMLFIKYGH
jgi:zinc and cadmium transporter